MGAGVNDRCEKHDGTPCHEDGCERRFLLPPVLYTARLSTMIAACLPSVSVRGCFQGKAKVKNQRRRVLKSLCASLFVPSLAWAQDAQQPVKIAMIEGLSGAFANTGEAVFRNLVWAVERVNQRGGVRTAQGMRPLQLTRYDSKGQNEEALSALRAAIDDGAAVRAAGQFVGHRGGADRRDQQAQRARARQARAVPQLLRGRPDPHQREVQLLALPLRRPCRHAHDRADGGAQGRQVA